MKIMVTSFKRSHVCTATLSAPSPAAGHHQPTPLLGPGAHKICLSPLSVSGRNGFVSTREFAPPTILLGLLLCPSMWGISSQPLQHLLCYWGFSDLGHGVSPHGRSSEVQLLLLILDVGYLLTASPTPHSCTVFHKLCKIFNTSLSNRLCVK